MSSEHRKAWGSYQQLVTKVQTPNHENLQRNPELYAEYKENVRKANEFATHQGIEPVIQALITPTDKPEIQINLDYMKKWIATSIPKTENEVYQLERRVASNESHLRVQRGRLTRADDNLKGRIPTSFTFFCMVFQDLEVGYLNISYIISATTWAILDSDGVFEPHDL
jgi:hypothetical protein